MPMRKKTDADYEREANAYFARLHSMKYLEEFTHPLRNEVLTDKEIIEAVRCLVGLIRELEWKLEDMERRQKDRFKELENDLRRAND